MTRLRRMLGALVTAALVGANGTAALASGAKIFVVGGKPDDPFWSIVKRGAEDAGVLLTGGFGSVLGIVFGTVTFAVVSQGIYFTSIDRNWSSLIIGIVLLLAVTINNGLRKLALTTSPRKA